MNKLHSTIAHWNLENKRVFVRADMNVPLASGTILSDYRLTALIPTITLLQSKGAKIILASHIGRPQKYIPALSTQHLIPWFAAHGYSIDFAPNIQSALAKSKDSTSSLVLMENLRFYPGEKECDLSFAQSLADLADYYVNDAFGTLHRPDCSMTAVPQLFAPDKRSIGLLVEKELKELSVLRTHPQKPFVLILGGGKVADKLPLIESMIPLVSHILLAPAIACTFLQALGKPTGRSLVEHDMVQEAKRVYELGVTSGTQLILPTDFIAAHQTIQGTLKTVALEQFPQDYCALSIGPATCTQYIAYIAQAHTVLYNGLMGLLSRPETLSSAHIIFRAMAQNPHMTVIAGGDSVAAAQEQGLADQIRYLSTGGGATLTYLSGKPLPGLTIFI